MRHYGKRAIALLLVLVFMIGMLPTSAFAAEAEGHTEHTWSEWAVTAEPTCTEDGSQERSCSVCGYTESEAIPASGHTWGAWTVTAAPTCAEGGSQERSCSVCGATESEAIPAPGHTWGEWTVTAAPTCTKDGSREHSCTICGYTESEVIPAPGHTWGEWTVTAAPTCTEEGAHEHTCSVCGVTESEAIPALGHTWGEWTVTAAPTCTEEGAHEHTCSVCNVTESEAMPALGHTWGEWTVTVEPSCEVEGAHEHTCSVCGVTESEVMPAKGHEWTEDNGVDLVKCKVCGVYQVIAEGGSFDFELHGEQWLITGDVNADVEDQAVWNAMFADLILTGNWAEDLLTVAQSQIGYPESSANYAVSTGGHRNGYTRYGAWYGIPYGDWCAMFISFCLNYADIPESAMPYDCSCASWAETLDARSMFAYRGSYVPKSGDLIFYYGSEGYPDHVGIVNWYDANTGVINTIEGNFNDRVATRQVGLYDPSITGYGMLPENPALAPKPEPERVEKTISAAAGDRTITVSGMLPADAELSVVSIPLGAAEEILNAQGNASLADMKVVVAFDVTILSDGKKYDLEEYGDSITVSVSDVTEEVTGVMHVKIDVTDGNGGLDLSSLNTAMTQKQDSEMLSVEAAEDGAVFFDLTSCSVSLILAGSTRAVETVDVTVNVNWGGDRANSASITHRPSTVSFQVEVSADGGTTWTPVDGSYTLSGGTDTDTWTNAASPWQFPAEDENHNPLTYRVSEINDTETFTYPADNPDNPDPNLTVARYTMSDPQVIGATGTVNFDNSYNWPWPLIDFADYYYADPTSPSYINPLQTTIQAGPCSDNNCTQAVDPDKIEAGEEVYYKIGYILDQAQSYPYSNGGRAMFDSYHDVKLTLLLPEGLYLMAHGHISGIPAEEKTITIGGKNYTQYTIKFSEDDTSPSGSGSFSIRVRVGNNGTVNSISTYDLENMLHLEAKYDLVDKTLPETSDKYTVKTYQSEDNDGTDDISTVSPDEWGVQKIVKDPPVVNVNAGTVTYTWTIKVGLKSGEPQYEGGASNPDYLLSDETPYKRTGREAVTKLTLQDVLEAELKPASTAEIPAPVITMQKVGDNTPVKTLTDTSVVVWGTGADTDLELNKKMSIISDNGSTPNVITPLYTTYTVTATYDVSGLIGEFYQPTALNLDTTNTINLDALFPHLPEQDDSDRVAVSAPLSSKNPASFHIVKKLNQYNDSQIDYNGRYGPITYAIADSNGSPLTIYIKEDGSYSPYTGPLETGSDHVYYILPAPEGISYTMSETISSQYSNYMAPVSASAQKGTDNPVSGNAGSVSFSPGPEDSWTITFVNKETMGKVDIKKVDQNGTELEGAKFQLKDAQDNIIYVNDSTGTPQPYVVTDSLGKAAFDRLPYGTYTLTELEAPHGYTKDNRTEIFTIGEGPNGRLSYSYTFRNNDTRAHVVLKKYLGVGEPKSQMPQVNGEYPDATFELQWYKDGQWEPALDFDGHEITVNTLNNVGVITLDVAAEDENGPIQYRFAETLTATSTHYPADGQPGDKTAVTAAKEIAPGYTETFEMYNRKSVTIKVNKNFYDVGSNGDRTYIEADDYKATVALYRTTAASPTSTSDLELASTETKQVGHDNQSWTNLPACDPNGNPYTYYLLETPAEGFAQIRENNQDGTIVPLTDENNNTVYYSKITLASTKESYITTLFNLRKVIPIHFVKKNGTSQSYDLSGSEVTVYTAYTDETHNTIATDAQATIEGQPVSLNGVVMPAGTSGAVVYLAEGQVYYYRETKTTSGYTFSKLTSDVDGSQTEITTNLGTIDLTTVTQPGLYGESTKYLVYTVTNKTDPTIRIDKKSSVKGSNGQYPTVTGAQFQVYVKEDGAYVPFKKNGSDVKITTTNASSGVTLPAGTYYLAEIVTPTNYLNPNSAAAAALYNQIEGDSNVYTYDSGTEKTFVEIEFSETNNTFTFYNIPNTGKVKVQKRVDGQPVQIAGFTVELWNGNTRVGNAVQTGNDGTATLTAPVYDADCQKITYTVKEGDASTWSTTGNLKDKYYFIADGQQVQLEPGKTVTTEYVSSGQGGTLYVDNASYLEINATKKQFDGWQYSHGGFAFKMAGVTVGVYRRAMVKTEQGEWVPYEDKWVPVPGATNVKTDDSGAISFNKLIRGEKLDNGTVVEYEYALVELASDDTNYFPYRDDGDPQTDNFKEFAPAGELTSLDNYNYLLLEHDDISPTGPTYELGDMLNTNHWVQFHLTKWLDDQTITQNKAKWQQEEESHTEHTVDADGNSLAIDGNDTKLDDCIFSLYRYIVSDDDTMPLAFSNHIPLPTGWTCLGTYTTGTLYNTAGDRQYGQFLTMVDTNVNENYVYVLVEESTGPTGAKINPHFQYTCWVGKDGVSVSANGTSIDRTSKFTLDSINHTEALNTRDEGTGGSEIFLASFRLAKWREIVDVQTGEKSILPLSNARFKLYLGGTGTAIADLISGLDGGNLYALAQSGVFQLEWETVKDPETGETVETGRIKLLEYEVQGGEAVPYFVQDILETWDVQVGDKTYTVYGVPVDLVEIEAPEGYGSEPMRYQTYMCFVDKDPPRGNSSDTYRYYNDLYFVRDPGGDYDLAENQTEPRWYVTEDRENSTEAFGDGKTTAQLRLMNYPMHNIPVEVRKVGYVPTLGETGTQGKNSQQIALGNYGAVELAGVTMKLQHQKSGGGWEDWDYETNKPGTKTFTTKEHGEFFFEDGLQKGTYRIIETDLGDHEENYENAYDGTGIHFRSFVVGHTMQTVYMANPKKVNLKITKKSLIPTETNPLSGAVFKLGTLTSTESGGVYSFDNIPTGTYKLTEDTAPSGYSKGYFKTLFVESNPDYAALVGDDGMLLGYSYEESSGDVVVSNISPNPEASYDSATGNIVFQLEVKDPKLSSIKINKRKLGDDNTKLNTTFHYYFLPMNKVPASGQVTLPTIYETTGNARTPNTTTWSFVQAGWTNMSSEPATSSGSRVINNLEPGVYVFYEREDKVPNGHERLRDTNGNLVVYSVVVTGGLDKTVQVTPSSVTILNTTLDPSEEQTITTSFTGTNGGQVEFTAFNVPMTTMRGQKYVDWGELTSSDVSGSWSVTFNIYDAQTGGNKVATLTRTNGSLAYFIVPGTTNTQAQFSRNKTYYIEEVVNESAGTDAAHFPLASIIIKNTVNGTTTEIPVSLSSGGPRYPFTIPSGTGEIQIYATDEYHYGKVTFYKMNGTVDDALPGATIEIQHKVDGQWVKLCDAPELLNADLSGTGKYQAVFPLDSDELTIYRVHELVPPDGYVINPEKDYFEFQLKWDKDKPDDKRGNVLDLALDFTQLNVNNCLINLQGIPLTVTKYDNVRGTEGIAPAESGKATFSLYHKENGTWTHVADKVITTGGIATFDGANLLIPGHEYFLAETHFSTDLFNDRAGMYKVVTGQPDEELVLQDIKIDENTTIEDCYVFTATGAQEIQIKAYNVPYLKPWIQKLDVGQYPVLPTPVIPMMTFKVFELPENYTLPEDETARDALVTTLSASTNTTDTTIPRIVFQSSTNASGHENVETTYPGVTGNVLGTKIEWTTDTVEDRWTRTRRYLLVETEVDGTNNTYDTMVKDDERVHWYLVIDPLDADPAEAPTFTLTNINGVAGVELTKTVVQNSVNPESDVDSSDTVDSLISGSRKVVYTLDPEVSGKNQMLKSFILKETGLAEMTDDDIGQAEDLPAAVPDYEITKVVVGNASHMIPASLGLSGAPIFADVTFMDAGGSAIGSETVPLQNSTAEDRTLGAPSGTKTFTIAYYSPVLYERTNEVYKLGEEFEPEATTVYMTVKQITTVPAVHISKFKNTSEAVLVYPKWSKKGEGPTDTPLTASAKAIVNVRGLEIPLVSVDKIIDAETVSTGGVVKFVLTVSNKQGSTVPFKNPMLLDIMPTGVTFYDPGEARFKPEVTFHDADHPFTLKYTSMIGQQVQSSVHDDNNNVYADAETCVLFELTGELQPNDHVEVSFYGLVGPSALLYDQASTTVKIQNDVYLSSAEHTYKTPQNPNGYSFAISGNSSEGYVFGNNIREGDDIATAASPDRTAKIHEAGVHDRLKNEGTTNPDYTNGTNFIWIRATDDVPVVAGQVLTLHKQVKGDRDSIFHGEEELGVATRTFTDETSHYHDLTNGYVDWLLIIDAGPSFPAKKLVVGDAIPKVGDAETRKSCWDVDFDSITSIQLEGFEVDSDLYTVWYYKGPIEGASDVIKGVLNDAREWSTTNPPDAQLWTPTMPADKSKITGFVIVFDQTLEIAISHALTIMYHTLVPACNDEEAFAKIAFLNATNDFFVLHDDFTRAEKSNPVSVTLMDQDVEVQGDVWIDEDWDAEQQIGGNRRDYSQYAIIQELVGDGTSGNPGRIGFTMKDERRSAAGETIPEAARGTNTSIGESIRHFTFKRLGAALYTGDAPLYGPDNYLNAGIHKLGDGLYGALKGTDPFHYSLYATFNAGETKLMDVFKLTTRGSGHYMSDDPDNLAGAEEKANALDSNFAVAGRAIENYNTYPFYIRYSALVDQSKDIGFRSYRGLIINKVADDDPKTKLEGVKFEIYGPYEDTTLVDPNSTTGEKFSPKTPAYGYNGKLTFSLIDGVYVYDPDSTDTELVTDGNGQIRVSGLNWWKEYEVVETATIAPYSIEGTVTADAASFAQILDEGEGKFMLLVPATGKTSEKSSDVVTVTNKRGLDFEFVKRSAEVTVDAEGVDVLSTGDPLAGATFGLFTDEACTKPFKNGDDDVTATSDSNGKVKFTLLPYGTYYMKEVSLGTSQNDYWLNTTVYKVHVVPKTNTEDAHVEVTMVSGSGTETAVDAFGTGMLVPVKDADGHVLKYQYEVLNVKVKVKAKLIKVDEDDNTKKLPGAQFGLYSDAACETTALSTVTTDDNGEASFGWLAPGTYYLKETMPPEGYPLSDTIYTLVISYSVSTDRTYTITVTFDGNTVTLDNGKATFSVTVTNTFVPVKLKIPVKKEITSTTGTAPTKEAEFTFTITAASGTPLPNPTTVKIKGAGSATFGEITYTKAGTYTYTVKETACDDSSHYNPLDSTEWTVEVTVANDSTDGLKITGYKITKGSQTTTATSEQLQSEKLEDASGKKYILYTPATPALAVVFDNPYTPDPVKLKIPVKKIVEINPNITQPNLKFVFDLTAKNGAPMPTSTSGATVTINWPTQEEGEFGKITFTKAGTYEYTVVERAGSDPGVVYDTTPRTVVVTVTVNANDELEAHYSWAAASTASTEGEGTEATSDAEPAASRRDEPVEFTNKYEDGSLRIEKHVYGNRGDRTRKFKFRVDLIDANGDKLPSSMKFRGMKYTASGSLPFNIKSGDTIELKDGEYAVITGLPVGIYYEVEETNSYSHTVTSTGEIGRIIANTTVTAVFKNYKSDVPKTGETDLLPVTVPMMGVSGLGMILTALFGKKRKPRKDK
ncbi:MAG: hypothetical protein K6F56_08295 [Oscillospiraceae bacterium]|nr:hypothetical protein [Oscillospiraceae bacterium]